MSHNPIISSATLSGSFISSIFSQSNLYIPEGSTGLLYIHGKFMRTLSPGEQDRTSNGTLYVVDMCSNSFSFSLELPSATTPYRFPIQITIEYQVENPRLMIDNKISDTEQVIIKTIEPVLQRLSRDVPIEKYRSLLITLESAISQNLLSSVGFRLDTSIINIDHNEYWQTTILQLLMLRQSSHIELLPTSDRNYSFNVMTNLAYSIADTTVLSESPSVAENVLWQQISKEIRRMCSEYSFRQVRDAEQNIQSYLSKNGFAGFGIEIQSINISIDIDKKSQDILDIEHQIAFEKSKNELEEIRRLFQGNTIGFYQQFVGINDPVRNSLLAYILAKSPDDANSILNYLDDREKVLVERQLNILQTLINAGDMWDEKTQIVIHDILNVLKGSPLGLTGVVNPPVRKIDDKKITDHDKGIDIITISEDEIIGDEICQEKTQDTHEEPTFKPFDVN
jgi:hypothetical protein